MKQAPPYKEHTERDEWQKEFNNIVRYGRTTYVIRSTNPYKSSNPKVATIAPNGVVTGRSPGITYITIDKSHETS